MGELKQGIAGLALTPLKRISTPAGDVLHALKAQEDSFTTFGEAYFSMIEPDQIKGWKRHKAMTMNLVVPVGRIGFLVRDEREGSPTKGRTERVELSPNSLADYGRLTVAPDLWMAFGNLDTATSILLNIIDIPHDPDEAETRPLDAFDHSPLSYRAT